MIRQAYARQAYGCEQSHGRPRRRGYGAQVTQPRRRHDPVPDLLGRSDAREVLPSMSSEVLHEMRGAERG